MKFAKPAKRDGKTAAVTKVRETGYETIPSKVGVSIVRKSVSSEERDLLHFDILCSSKVQL